MFGLFNAPEFSGMYGINPFILYLDKLVWWLFFHFACCSFNLSLSPIAVFEGRNSLKRIKNKVLNELLVGQVGAF
jgi:hypothetical protein